MINTVSGYGLQRSRTNFGQCFKIDPVSHVKAPVSREEEVKKLAGFVEGFAQGSYSLMGKVGFEVQGAQKNSGKDIINAGFVLSSKKEQPHSLTLMTKKNILVQTVQQENGKVTDIYTFQKDAGDSPVNSKFDEIRKSVLGVVMSAQSKIEAEEARQAKGK